jgi:16S rRNA U1498 N3-methylase RsmE
MANMSMKKCPMPVQDPLVRWNNFDEVALGYTYEMAVEEAKRCLNCKNKPCQSACPVAIDIPAFIAKVAEEDMDGAYEIIAFPSARCISKPDEKSLKKKLERWQKIAASAAEQSGRGLIPEVLILPSYKAALERASQADKALFFYENEQATTLKMALSAGSYETVKMDFAAAMV